MGLVGKLIRLLLSARLQLDSWYSMLINWLVTSVTIINWFNQRDNWSQLNIERSRVFTAFIAGWFSRGELNYMVQTLLCYFTLRARMIWKVGKQRLHVCDLFRVWWWYSGLDKQNRSRSKVSCAIKRDVVLGLEQCCALAMCTIKFQKYIYLDPSFGGFQQLAPARINVVFAKLVANFS